MRQHLFCVIGNSYNAKTLREDRTAAVVKCAAYGGPPQAENLASEILCSMQKTKKDGIRRRKDMRDDIIIRPEAPKDYKDIVSLVDIYFIVLLLP